jgi:hypothetical protein
MGINVSFKKFSIPFFHAPDFHTAEYHLLHVFGPLFSLNVQRKLVARSTMASFESQVLDCNLFIVRVAQFFW